jgi:hypothetical protein
VVGNICRSQKCGDVGIQINDETSELPHIAHRFISAFGNASIPRTAAAGKLVEIGDRPGCQAGIQGIAVAADQLFYQRFFFFEDS